MEKWEYKVVDLRPIEAEEELNRLGEEGWQFVQVQGTRYYFARQVGTKKAKKTKG